MIQDDDASRAPRRSISARVARAFVKLAALAPATCLCAATIALGAALFALAAAQPPVGTSFDKPFDPTEFAQRLLRWQNDPDRFRADREAFVALENYGDQPDALNRACDLVVDFLRERPDLAQIETFGFDPDSARDKRLQLFKREELDDAVALATIGAAFVAERPETLTLEATARRAAKDRDPDALKRFADAAATAAARDANLRELHPFPPSVVERANERLAPKTRLVSSDGKFAAVFLLLRDPNDDRSLNRFERRAREREQFRALDELVERIREETGVDATLAGLPFLARLDLEGARNVATRVALVGSLALFLLFWITLGDFPRAFLALVLCAGIVVATLGARVVCGGTISSELLAPLALVLALAVEAIALWIVEFSAARPEERSALAATSRVCDALAPAIVAQQCAAIALAATFAALARDCQSAALVVACGALATMLATFFVLPAALMLLDRLGARVRPTVDFAPIFRVARRRPRATLCVLLAAALAALPCAATPRPTPARFAYVPQDAPEMRAARRCAEKLGFNPTLFAVLRADLPSELRGVKSRIAEDGAIVVDDVWDAVPKPNAARNAKIENICDVLDSLRPTLPEIPDPDPDAFLQLLLELQENASQDARQSLDAARDAYARLEPNARRDALARFQRALAVEYLKRLRELQRVAAREPIATKDLSENLRARLGNLDDLRPGMRVYSAKDPTNAENLSAFVANLRVASSNVAGAAPDVCDRARRTKLVARFAFAVAAIVFLIVVACDERSLRAALGAFLAPLLAACAACAAVGLVDARPDSALGDAPSFLAFLLAAPVARATRTSPRASNAALTLAAAVLACLFAATLAVPAPGWQDAGRRAVLAVAVFFAVATLFEPARENWDAREEELEQDRQEERDENARQENFEHGEEI